MKPDLRAIESILLKERRALIDSGVERKNIRMSLRNASIYVNKSLFGRIVSSTFQRLDSNNLLPSSTSSALPISAPNSLTFVPTTTPVPDSHHAPYASSTVEANIQEDAEGQLANESDAFLD